MRVVASTTIRATPERVWNYITVPENGPRWQEGAVWTEVRTPGPIRLGSEMDHIGRWLGRRVRTRAIVTVFEPLRDYGYDITTKLFPKPALMRYRVEATDGGASLTLSNEAPVPFWMKPISRLLERNAQGMFERDVARLKQVIESEDGAASDPA